MAKKKQKGKTSSPKKRSLRQPDHRLKPVDEAGTIDIPQVFKIVKRGKEVSEERREFLKKLTGIAGLSTLAGSIEACDGSEYLIDVDSKTCRCHVVCACDAEGEKASKRSSLWESQYSGLRCTCDTVCTCNTVCNCDTVCTCDSEGGGGGGGGGHYWYPS